MSSVTMSSKGWVVIPAVYRKKYRMKAGSSVEVVDYGGGLSLVPSFEEATREAQGLLRGGSSLTQALVRERRKERDHEHRKGR
ncbi:MAG: AbrB/MazE/SpoVT family DNA-binding domain-containing protein [Kiritimatiellae bacterium]|nr:AbrB/MazE/SpoVT family DNA-binding domain-containing protein [Kiritimatiellia bacterium]MDD4736163.1 AbrB/MazE/SpoVT family DNA-binding domain-containing protein [Kiritimatiellia bacterium]